MRSVMTDPQELWVGPGSQAAREKAQYEVGGGEGGWGVRSDGGRRGQRVVSGV